MKPTETTTPEFSPGDTYKTDLFTITILAVFPARNRDFNWVVYQWEFELPDILPAAELEKTLQWYKATRQP
jgi:hypothetical protein